MENTTTIKWAEIDQPTRGRTRIDNVIRMSNCVTSTGSKSKKTNTPWRLSFPLNVAAEVHTSKFIRFGKLADKVIIQFNDVNGVPLCPSSLRKNDLRVNGKSCVDFILTNMKCERLDGYYNIAITKISDKTWILSTITFNFK